MSQLKQIASQLRSRASFYRRVRSHPGTPLLSKALIFFALAYLACPIDVIPDAIPVVGHLDDLVIVPLLIVIAMRLVPKDVYEDCRE